MSLLAAIKAGATHTVPFDPLTLCNPLHAGWASDPDWDIADGTPVSAWPNRGSVGGNPAQATEANQPTWQESTINGRPGVVFNGNNFLTSSIGVARPLSMMCVSRLNVLTGTARFSIGRGSGGSGIGMMNGPVWGYYSSEYFSSGVDADTADHIHTLTLVGNTGVLLVDGEIVVSGSASSLTSLSLGARSTGASQWVGPITFYAIYAGDVTTHPDYAQLLSGLGNYYGIPLS